MKDKWRLWVPLYGAIIRQEHLDNGMYPFRDSWEETIHFCYQLGVVILIIATVAW